MSTTPAYDMMINSVLFLRDMNREQIAQSVRQITHGLKESSSYAFKTRRLIPRDPKVLHSQVEQTEAAIHAARETATSMLRTPNARALMESAVLTNMTERMMKTAQNGLNAVINERALLIDEVWAEPIRFSPEFHANAQILKKTLVDMIRKHDLTPLPALSAEQMEAVDLLVHGVALLTANVADEMSDLLFDRFMGELGSGIYAPPSREDMRAIRDAMEARDAEIGEFLEAMREAEDEMPTP